MIFLKLAIILLLFAPASASAYLDPGTGNAILAALFGLAGSLVFFSKNIFYAIKGAVTGKKQEKFHADLAIFCEGAMYWIYFRDIIAELIRRGIRFTYYTMDMNDPGLELPDWGNRDADISRFKVRFVGGGSRGHAAISNLKEPYILATTPNIGTPGYPIKKPKHCKNLIHIFHAPRGVSSYKKYALDRYDTVFVQNESSAAEIREIEAKRGLPEKNLLPGGLPYFDAMRERAAALSAAGVKRGAGPHTVLVASTWNKRGCLQTYGASFIIALSEAGFDVIVRPHPYSWRYEADFIAKLKQELSGYGNVVFDDSIDNIASLARADVLVSDISGARLDFFLLFGRPVVSLECDSAVYDDYEQSGLSRNWDVEVSTKIGVYLKRGEIDTLPEMVKNIGAVRLARAEDIITNTGVSKMEIADGIERIMGEEK
jgi:hypothetical protein